MPIIKRIAVLSDTHIPVVAADLPKAVYQGIAGVDLILHAGDLVELDLLDRLAAIAPVKAVCGNMDNDRARGKLPEKEIITVGPLSIGLIHGRGAPQNLLEMVSREFQGVNAIIFGHSHTPVNLTRDGILFFNPGSPTDTVFAPYNSYGVLEIKDSTITGRIIKI